MVWIFLRASSALALALAPCHVTFDGMPGIAATKAFAGNGNSNGGGNGGNGNGGNSGSAGGSNSGSAGGSNSGNGGDNGNSNGQGDNGNSNAGGGNPNAGPGNNSGKGNTNPGSKNSYTNAATGDTLSIDGDKVTVVHRNGMKEQVQNGRFEMKDAQGRTIINRQATKDDVSRLLNL
ncbi:hypothetical protein FJW06_27020 [Mesorhizobium sp. B4-1-3]|uniref:hypothetical protein n=1 Tax=Mesorhizobium sp. B4-1-3 TaxID=2589889 RepID=UPI00112976D9|nr:hypothetical protein [Mesorhizobium sp. B4-1-3]TPI09300.1 hypothetical protein FJW06_27020 [Mesorhizobium sp. B4-1-3]